MDFFCAISYLPKAAAGGAHCLSSVALRHPQMECATRWAGAYKTGAPLRQNEFSDSQGVELPRTLAVTRPAGGGWKQERPVDWYGLFCDIPYLLKVGCRRRPLPVECRPTASPQNGIRNELGMAYGTESQLLRDDFSDRRYAVLPHALAVMPSRAGRDGRRARRRSIRTSFELYCICSKTAAGRARCLSTVARRLLHKTEYATTWAGAYRNGAELRQERNAQQVGQGEQDRGRAPARRVFQ